MPPAFWANAGQAATATNNGTASADALRNRIISVHLLFPIVRPIVWALNAKCGLLVEPDVFKAPAVEDAVDHHPQALDPRLPAGGEPQVVDDRSRLVLLQSSGLAWSSCNLLSISQTSCLRFSWLVSL